MSDMLSVAQYPTHLEESDNQAKIGLIKGDHSCMVALFVYRLMAVVEYYDEWGLTDVVHIKA